MSKTTDKPRRPDEQPEADEEPTPEEFEVIRARVKNYKRDKADAVP